MLLSELSLITQDMSYFKISCSYFDIAAEVLGQESLWPVSSILLLLESILQHFASSSWITCREGKDGVKRSAWSGHRRSAWSGASAKRSRSTACSRAGGSGVLRAKRSRRWCAPAVKRSRACSGHWRCRRPKAREWWKFAKCGAGCTHIWYLYWGPDARRVFIEARHSFFQVRRTLFLDKRHTFSVARHPLTYCSCAFMNMRRPLLVTESKIVTPFSKNCYIKAQDAHNSHKCRILL
jgi:hypothetical protein